MSKILQTTLAILLLYMPFFAKGSDIENNLSNEVIASIEQYRNKAKTGFFYGMAAGLTVVIFLEQCYRDGIIEPRYGNWGRLSSYVLITVLFSISGAGLGVDLIQD